MVGNSWLWPRLIAAFAASLTLMFLPASAQEQKPETAASLAKTSLRDLRLAALSDPKNIAVQWRHVSNGETIKIAPSYELPELQIKGLKTRAPVLTDYAKQGVESVIVILVSGRTTEEAAYFYETAKFAVDALPAGQYRVLVGNAANPFEWVSDFKLEAIGKDQDWTAAFEKVDIEYVAKAPQTATLVRAFADAMEVLKQASPQSRVALLAPETLFPDGPELLKQLTDAAYAQRISFFPIVPSGGVNPARAQQMNDIAGPTAGRFIPDALTGRTADQRLALFSEFLSGTSAVFEIAPPYQYTLPWENIKPVEVTVNYGDVTDTISLAHDRPTLNGSKLFGAVINPAHWGSWLIDANRWPYGLGVLVLWLALIGVLLRILVPPVKMYVQIAGEDGVQNIRRLPAVIGRGTHANINLDNDGVSREHAEIRKDGRGLALIDLGSSNGTWIGGERVKKTPLTKVQTVQIGPVRLILRPRRVRAPIKDITANSHE